MEKKLLQKQELAKALNIEFDEIVDLFSVETLENFKMEEAIGGTGSLSSPRGIFDLCPNICPSINFPCPSVNACPNVDVCPAGPGTNTSCGGGGIAGAGTYNCNCDIPNTCGTKPGPTPLYYCG